VNDFSQFRPILDKFAITASGFCTIHCLFLPVFLAVFSAMGATLFGQDAFHVYLLGLVLPLSIVALLMGCRKHRSRMVALLGFAGLTVLVIAASLGHDGLGETGERAATLAGSTLIALGHLRNFSLCRRMDCEQ
jgi:hypothetical protein